MFFIKLFFLLFSNSYSLDETILYHKTKKGSDFAFNPISYYLNASFDTIQNPYYFSQSNYFKKHELVFKRVRNPFKGIRDGGGINVLLRDEFVPFAKRAVPNYTLHLIGGGYDFRRLAEWYNTNEYSHPYLWAFFTQYAAAFGNEAIEASNTRDIGPHDHIADLYFFDLVGKVLFTDDRIVHFFKDKVELVAWPFQPTYDFNNNKMMNAATNYIARPNVFNSEWRPFIFAGLQILGGVSYIKDNQGFSMATGIAPTDPLRGKGRLSTGFFWDEEGSLLTSLFINGSEDQNIRLNIFPGIIKVRDISPGIFAALKNNNDIQLGVQTIVPIGVGLEI